MVARRIILEVLDKTKEHLSAEDIYLREVIFVEI